MTIFSVESEPVFSVSFARSRVVIWWQRALLAPGSPPVPALRVTTVGPRLACVVEVESGTTIMERQAEV